MVIEKVNFWSRENFDKDRETKYTNFTQIQQLQKKFIEKYGTNQCTDIHSKLCDKSFDLREKAERVAFRAAGGHCDHGCTEVVADATKWAVEILAKEALKTGN